jgi:glycosyltransferase involved in cell wall biosynthesis
MSKVSVIIPNYNHAAYLRQRIQSVLNQTYLDFEVIILDDCSTDDSRTVIDEFRNDSRISRVVYNEINSGSTFRQWNKGIEFCNADIIWIAESDDFAHPDFLSALVPQMVVNKNVGISYCQSYKVNSANKVTGTWKEYTDDLNQTKFAADFSMSGIDYIKQFLIHRNTIPNASAVVFRKKFYQLSGGAEPGIKYCSDWLTWLKILLMSDVVYVSEPLNYFRYHEESVIANAIRNIDSNRYTEQYGRTMRERFHQYLQDNYPIESGITSANCNYIFKEHGSEGLFDIQNRKLVSGWKKIGKSLYSSDAKWYYMKSGLRQSVKHVLGI